MNLDWVVIFVYGNFLYGKLGSCLCEWRNFVQVLCCWKDHLQFHQYLPYLGITICAATPSYLSYNHHSISFTIYSSLCSFYM